MISYKIGVAFRLKLLISSLFGLFLVSRAFKPFAITARSIISFTTLPGVYSLAVTVPQPIPLFEYY